jgi:hypothetical protein
VSTVDIPKRLKHLRQGDWESRIVLLAPQLPSKRGSKLKREADRLGIDLWELSFAYAIPGRYVKWWGRDQKRFREIYDENELYEAIFKKILKYLRKLGSSSEELRCTGFEG